MPGWRSLIFIRTSQIFESGPFLFQIRTSNLSNLRYHRREQERTFLLCKKMKQSQQITTKKDRTSNSQLSQNKPAASSQLGPSRALVRNTQEPTLALDTQLTLEFGQRIFNHCGDTFFRFFDFSYESFLYVMVIKNDFQPKLRKWLALSYAGGGFNDNAPQ